MFDSYLSAASMSMTNPFSNSYQEFKDKLLNRWKESRKLPRKKKKEERKNIKVLWSINEWSKREFAFLDL